MGDQPGDNRRMPRNLEGLFRFCTENTQAEDATDQSRFEPMTDERGELSGGDLGVDSESDCSSTLTTLPDLELARKNQNKALSTLGLYRYKIPGDGNCMFRSVASQLRLDQERYHPILRKAAVAWMWQHVDDLLAGGLLDDAGEIDETCKLGAWPSQAALVSLANVLEINIALIQGGDQGNLDIQHVTPFEMPVNQDCGGIILAYLYNGHYDAVVHEPNLPNPEYRIWVTKVKERYNVADDVARELAMHDPYSPYLSCDENSFDDPPPPPPPEPEEESPPIGSKDNKKRALFTSGNSWNAFSMRVEDTPSSSSKSTTSDSVGGETTGGCYSPEPGLEQDGYESSGKDSLRLSHPDLSEVALGPIDGKHLEEELECLQKAAEELQGQPPGGATGGGTAASPSDHCSTPSSTHSFIIHDDIEQAPVTQHMTEHMQEVMDVPEKETRKVTVQALRAQGAQAGGGEGVIPEEEEVEGAESTCSFPARVDADIDSGRESSHSSLHSSSLHPSSSDSLRTEPDYVTTSYNTSSYGNTSSRSPDVRHAPQTSDTWLDGNLRRPKPDHGKLRPHSVHDPGFAQSAFAKISQSSVPLLRESMRRSHTTLTGAGEREGSYTPPPSAFRPVSAGEPRAFTQIHRSSQPPSSINNTPSSIGSGISSPGYAPVEPTITVVKPKPIIQGRATVLHINKSDGGSYGNESGNYGSGAAPLDNYVESSESTVIRVEPTPSSSSSSSSSSTRTFHIPINIVGPTITQSPRVYECVREPGSRSSPVTAVRVEKTINIGGGVSSNPGNTTQKVVLDNTNRPTSVVRLETWERPRTESPVVYTTGQHQETPIIASSQGGIRITQLRSSGVQYQAPASSTQQSKYQEQPSSIQQPQYQATSISSNRQYHGTSGGHPTYQATPSSNPQYQATPSGNSQYQATPSGNPQYQATPRGNPQYQATSSANVQYNQSPGGNSPYVVSSTCSVHYQTPSGGAPLYQPPQVTQLSHHVPSSATYQTTQARGRPAPFVRLTTGGDSIVIPTTRQVHLSQDISLGGDTPASPHHIRINISSESQRTPTVHRISAKPGSVIEIPIKLNTSGSGSGLNSPTSPATPTASNPTPWRTATSRPATLHHALHEVLKPLKSHYDVDRIESMLRREFFRD